MELLERAGQGDLDGVKNLIQQRVYVNTTNSCKQTALYLSCEKGYTEVAQYLLESGASVDLGEKPLIAAVKNKHYDCVKLLLQHNAYINCSNTKGESPMSVARQKCHYSVILLLLQYGAVPPASLGDDAVQLLKSARDEHAQAIEKLINNKIINLTSESTFLSAFSYAFKRGSVELAERMLSSDSYSKTKQHYPEAAYYSAKNNWPTILSKLLAKGVDINLLTDGYTPLYVACKEGHEAVVTLLLNSGADPNVLNKYTVASKDFLSPLQVAVQRGNAGICDILLGKGAEFNQRGEPLLHIACSGAAGEAVETKSVEQMHSVIRLLLQQGSDVNAISDKGDTALYRACVSQQLKIVQILLEAGADVNLTSRGCYPVIAACEACNAELINLLIKAGADVNCRKSNREMCLHVIINAYSSNMSTGSHQRDDSVFKLDTENAIKSLLEAGVDVDAICSDGETALYRATKSGLEVIIRVLLEAGAKTSDSTTRNPLHAACEQGYTQIVDLLLQHGVDCNVPESMGFSVYRYTNPSSLPVCCALKKGHADIVYMLLKSAADVNKQDQYGKSALIYFVELLASQRCKTSQASNTLDKESLNMLKSMLLAGGDVNQLSSRHEGLNALHTASSFGMCEIMMELIQHGADCNCLTANGKSALDLACEKGHDAAVELLLKNGAKPDRENTDRNRGDYFSYDSHESGKSALCTSAMIGSETMVKMLLKHGADVNASDEKGNTALHLARSSAIIEMLLNAGADVNATNNNTETALSITCEKQHKDKRYLGRPSVQPATDAKVIKMLLEFGADPNICYPLHTVCKNNDVDAVRLLLTYGADANVVKDSVCISMLPFVAVVYGLYIPVKVTEPSPLCIACKNGNTAMVDCLLTNGAAVTFADEDGDSPLHYAVKRLAEQEASEDYDPIVTLLLQHNAAVNVVSKSGESPLYAACLRGLTGVVKQLLDCRADVGLTTATSNKFPLMVACEKKFRDIAIMLLDRGADANVCQDEQTPLKLASANGDAVLVKQLLASGADVDDTALHAAVVGNKGLHNEAFSRIVQMLLKNGAKANALNCSGETPLYLACRPTSSVNVDIVRTLLVHGADPNIRPSSSSSSWSRNQVIPPLSSAAICGNSELIGLLIKFGARLDQTDDFNRTALHFATGTVDTRIEGRLQSSKTDTSAAEILLSAGADANVMDKNGATPLYLTCDRGMTEFVKLLLSHGASPNTGTNDKYPIFAAFKGQHYDSVKLLLEYNADVTVRGKNGKACLHHVLESESHHRSHDDKRSDLVQLLLDKAADMHTASDDGETPFYVACSNGLQSVVAKMLECGAKANGNIGTKLPLVVACRNKRVSVVQLLLINGADPNIPEEGDAYRYHLTLPLHIAAAGENIELVKLLLKHGANVDVRDNGGNTALHHLLERCHRHTVASSNAKLALDILLENKADVNIASSSGETPLYRAASRQLPDVVSKMLQKYGGNPNTGSPLVAACLVQNEELVEMLLKHGANPNVVSTTCDSHSKQQKLPLFVALKGDKNYITSLLLNAGANVNMMNDEGRNTVCFVAELLITSGYYPSNEQRAKKLSTIHLLLQHGANFNMLLPDGHSPLRLVVTAMKEAQIRRGDQKRLTLVVELLQLMIKHGAMLLDSVCLEDSDISRMQSLNSGMLKTLSTFDDKHEFIVDLLRAGAGFQVIAACCDALATSTREAKSIRLCQAVVLAGYSPSTEELQNLQVAAAGETEAGGVLEQLLNWLNEDKQQVPSLFRQCRIAVRRQLSEAVRHQTIIPAIDELPLPNDVKLYLQFAGSMTEVDLSINKDLLTAEETSEAQRRQLLSPYNSEHSDYDFSDYEDYYDYYNYDSDRDSYYSDSDEPRWW